MRQFFLIVLSNVFLLSACSQDPMDLLSKAKNKLNSNGSVAYRQVALWPNPVGKVDTIVNSSFFYRNEKALSKYDFIGLTERADVVYINNALKKVVHRDSSVFIYREEEQDEFVRENIIRKYSPFTILNQSSWNHVGDTVMQGRNYRAYERVEMDTLIEGNKVYVKNNIFINTASALLERYERSSYFNGSPSQVIVHRFIGYKLSKEGKPLAYNFPEQYESRIFGDKWKSPLLEGKEAPLFNAEDIDGKQVSLEQLRGKKVLLNFSVINCGYCKLALDHFNRQGYQGSEEITTIYINPVDKKPDVLDYADKASIPFPVIAGVKDMDDLYSVSVYPTFFLIDEQGKIEKIVYGYDKEFLDGIKR